MTPTFKIKVPQTLDQAAKLRKWLEQIAHKTPKLAKPFVSNLIYQIKAVEDEADLLSPAKQAHFAYQVEKLARVSR